MINRETLDAMLLYVAAHPGCGAADLCAAIYPEQSTFRSTGSAETTQVMRVLAALELVEIDPRPAGEGGHRWAWNAYQIAPLGRDFMRRKGIAL